jgi:hypothetical protein
MKNEDIMETCKTQMKIHIELLLERGMRSQNIEIELLHYIKKLLKKD